MTERHSADLAHTIARSLRERRLDITAHWLERIAARITLDPESVFPSEQLLDHVPILIEGIADYIEDPADEIGAEVPVVAKAMELGALRFGQGFDATEILKEYEILGGILFREAQDVAGELPAAEWHDALVVGQRIFRAVAVISQITTAHYLRMLAEKVGEREERLRRFNRMLTHELKNRVGAVLGAGQLLEEEWLDGADRRKFSGIVSENAQAIQKVLENLSALSRLDGDRRRQKNVLLPEAVAEVQRQLRDLARARGVRIVIEGQLPEVEVNAAAVELCLSNYLSNAIKYADMGRRERWAQVTASVHAMAAPLHAEPAEEAPAGPQPAEVRGEGALELVVRVRDNGMGVPADKRDRLFERFFRGHDVAVEGTGLGLSLVQETAESFGGRAWAEFDQVEGACFAFTLPCRRGRDRVSVREATEAA
jgi:signal transduction histidine kinase